MQTLAQHRVLMFLASGLTDDADGRFYIAPFSALEQTRLTALCSYVILK